jgi:uncharacterized lipoprotein YehR (DUF1307 family)
MKIKIDFKPILFIILATGLSSCENKIKKDERMETWYNGIKNEINTHASQKEDSITYDLQHGMLYVTYFLKGNKLRLEFRSPDTVQLKLITKYGQNNLFELRSEMYKNGHQATEGITYNDQYFGPWTVWYDNGQIMYRGYRFGNSDYGNWIYFTEQGEIQKQVDNRRAYFSDSILNKQVLRTSF